MPKGLNQKLKLYYLARVMLEHTDEDENHSLSLKEIQEYLNDYEITSERKSIYSDIEILEDFGIYIDKVGNGRNIKYHVTQRPFDFAEVKLLVDIIEASKFVTEATSDNLIKKLRTCVSSYQAQELKRQIHISGRVKGKKNGLYNLDEIHRAISNNYKITFYYLKWQKGKELVKSHDGKLYTVSPWGVTISDDNYYLIAYDSESEVIKHYRIDKMLSVNAIPYSNREGKSLYDKIDMGSYTKQNFDMYHGDTKKITFSVRNESVGVIYDKFGTGPDVFEMPYDKKHVKISTNVRVSKLFYSWIFGLGNQVKILEPQDVVEDMKKMIQEELKLY